jgi:Phosphate-selective porin O and P
MKKKHVITALLGLGMVWGLVPGVHADGPAPSTDAASSVPPSALSSDQPSLDQRVSALEDKLATLNPVTGTAVVFKADVSPFSGIGIFNGDGTYGIQFSGLAQEDSRTYFYNGLNTKAGLTAQPVNEFVLARARLQVDGYLGPRVHLRYQEDFSNNGSNSGVTTTASSGAAGGDGAELLDAYGELKLLPWTLLRVGQFKEPVDLERQRPTAALDFIQYSYTANLVVDRSQGALIEIADPKQVFYLAGGAFDGDTDAGSTPVVAANNSNKDAVAKLFVQPFNGGHGAGDLGLGVAGTAGNHSGDPDFSYKSLGQQTIVSPASGNAWTAAYVQGAGYHVVPQAYWYWKNFSALGEYVHESEGYRINAAGAQVNDYTVDSDAYQAQAGWIITGEHTSYSGWRLDQDSHSWGGLELVGRVQAADYDDNSVTTYNSKGAVVSDGLLDPEKSVTSLSSWSAGLNYVPVNDVEFLADYDQTNFTNGGVNGAHLVNRPTEDILQIRAQYTF